MYTDRSQPNIVLIHWHDLGTHISPYGHPDVDSPYLERLADQGLRFTHAYSTAPQCSPARGSLFTGRYPHANGLMGLAHRGWEYHKDEQTAPMLLSKHGYRSTLIGLQHESSDAGRLGFDEVIKPTTERAYGSGVADQATAWLDTATEAPFFLTVGFFETHRPYPQERYEPADPDRVVVPPYLPDNTHTRHDLASFLGAVKSADTATGRIIEAIDRNGLANNTLVIFTTDHGVAFPRAKGTLYDPGIQVALIMRPPRSWQVKPSVHDQMVSHVDVVPTLLDIVGARTPDAVHGQSFAPLLYGNHAKRRTEIFAEKTYHESYDPLRCVRTADFKYIRNLDDGPMLRLAPDVEESATRLGLGDRHLQPRPREELYDLRTDHWERHNVAGTPKYADISAELTATLGTWMERTADPIRHGPIAPPPQ